jgi:carbonic anhydrase
MSNRLKEILDANEKYSNKNPTLKDLKQSPKREIAILTCMDVRLDPLRLAGLELGDANVIRNAGGRASDDAIRSLIVTCKLIGAKEFFVIQHTACGMETFDNEIMADLLAGSLEKAEFDGKKWKNVVTGSGSEEGRNIDWLTIKNLKKSIIQDVNKIRNHPLIPDNIKINGLIYDVKTGKLNEIINL